MKLTRTAIRSPHIAVVLLLSIFATPLNAKVVGAGDHHRYVFERMQQKGISRDEAAALVKQRYGGKILKVSEAQKNGRAVYRVKGLSEKSQVYVVFVDKQSGRILR